MEYLLPQGAGLVHHGVPLFSPVRNAKQGHTRPRKILYRIDSRVQRFLGKQTGTGIENVFFTHNIV